MARGLVTERIFSLVMLGTACHVVPIFVPYMYVQPYVSTSSKNVRGGHKNRNFSKKAKICPKS
jgi:hypothetical protein